MTRTEPDQVKYTKRLRECAKLLFSIRKTATPTYYSVALAPNCVANSTRYTRQIIPCGYN